jgi:thioredoxin-like negative regulator of GroEL
MTRFPRDRTVWRTPARAAEWLAMLMMSLALVPLARAYAGMVPADDDVVLAVLPAALVEHREVASLRTLVSNEPRDLPATLQLVRLYLDADADTGDASYLDRAENLLNAWPTSTAQVPNEILMARAEVAQRAHRFDEADVALAAVLDREPNHRQARLTRAYVRIARGESRAALEDCASLDREQTPRVVNCVCRVRGLTGEASRAYDDIQRSLRDATHAGVWGNAELLELALTAADLAERLGADERASAHYRLALAVAPKNAFVQSAYADLLLARGDAATAFALIAWDDERLGLQVWRAIAAQRLGRSDAQPLIDALNARFALMRQRGDALATREYARFELDVIGDASTALDAALRNWRVQREPEDALLVLRAAHAAHDAGAAGPVSRWVAATHLEDARMRRLDSTWSG